MPPVQPYWDGPPKTEEERKTRLEEIQKQIEMYEAAIEKCKILVDTQPAAAQHFNKDQVKFMQAVLEEKLTKCRVDYRDLESYLIPQGK
jgi:hypothetical protein